MCIRDRNLKKPVAISHLVKNGEKPPVLLDWESLNSIGKTQLKTALTFANKLASITVTKKGANPPSLEEL